MVSRGVTRTGEIYCMSCGEYVEAGTSQCPSCDSVLDTEVKAFRCPRCERVNEFGTPECTSCGMRFKVKTLKLEGPSEESIVSELLGGDANAEEEPASSEGTDEQRQGSAGASMSDLEEQLAKREELVDRKIKGYAAKMKDLMAREQELQEKIAEFERRAESSADDGAKESERDVGEEARLVEEVNAAARRVQSLLVKVAGTEDGHAEAEGFSPLMDALERATEELLEERGRLEGKVREAAEHDDDLRKLMRSLDQLLERLPEDAVEAFSKTHEYTLYEHVLDRLKL